MRVVCPNCQLKGLVETGSESVKARIVCIRCATNFEVVAVDGKVQTVLAAANGAAHARSNGASSPDTAVAPIPEHLSSLADSLAGNVESEAEDILALPQSPAMCEQAQTEAPALSDGMVLETPELPQNVETAFEAEAIQDDKPASVSMNEEPAENLMPEEPKLVNEPVSEYAPGERSFEVSLAPKVAAAAAGAVGMNAAKAAPADYDKYSLGVRLLQVRPAWLLLSGLVFVGFITVCSWMIRPSAQADTEAASQAVLNNRATNQAPARTAPPVAMTAQASTKPAAANSAAAPVRASAAPAAAQTSAPATAPAVETKPAPAAPPVQQPASSKGNYTVQVGAFNDRSEANERVSLLRSAGYEARVTEAAIPGRGTWYRVQSGRFESRDEASRYGATLQSKKVVASVFVTEYRGQ